VSQDKITKAQLLSDASLRGGVERAARLPSYRFSYLLLSRSGQLGSFGILFTPTAMVIAQCALGLPIVIALVHRTAVGHWRTYGDALLVDGASRRRTIWPLLNIGREGLLTAFLAAFGRAIAEVGAIIIVGAIFVATPAR
jgi:ABC-type tungstate transport system substrate-binding protein